MVVFHEFWSPSAPTCSILAICFRSFALFSSLVLPFRSLGACGARAGAINVQPGNVQPWWIRYALVLFQEGRDFDSLAFLKRVQAKFEGVGEVCVCLVAFGCPVC